MWLDLNIGVSPHTHNFAQNGSEARGFWLGSERWIFYRVDRGHPFMLTKYNFSFLISEAHVFKGLSELFCSLLFAQLLNRQGVNIP